MKKEIRIGCKMNNKLKYSHTHWQAPQADTQSKACHKVCLSNAEKKKLKISFPFKNLKTANPQTDTKTFEQLVEKLNIDNGCKTLTTRTPGHKSSYKKLAVQWLNEVQFFNQTFVQVDSFVLRYRQLLIAANRCGVLQQQ